MFRVFLSKLDKYKNEIKYDEWITVRVSKLSGSENAVYQESTAFP